MRPGRKQDSRVRRRRDEVQGEVLGALGKSLVGSRPRRILDVGTGFGTCVQYLAKRFGGSARIWSVDASREVLREVRRSLRSNRFSNRVRLRQARAERLPFTAQRFDLVVSLLAVHHFSNPNKGLREMVRVLAPGGRLIVADWRPVKSPVVPHSSRDIPSPGFVVRMLGTVRSHSKQQGRYWYLIDATK